VKWEARSRYSADNHGTTCRTCAEPANRAGLANGRLDPGVYSIVKFEVVERGSGTKIVFDHTVFLKARRKTGGRMESALLGAARETPGLGSAGAQDCDWREYTDEKSQSQNQTK